MTFSMDASATDFLRKLTRQLFDAVDEKREFDKDVVTAMVMTEMRNVDVDAMFPSNRSRGRNVDLAGGGVSPDVEAFGLR